MHDYTMNKVGKFIKENYCPENMNCEDLRELYCWSKVMKNLLEADKDYHIIVSMEEHNDVRDIDMTIDEMLPRLNKLYNSVSTSEQNMLKTKIMNIIS